MSTEPRDLGPLEKAVNDAAARASNLWISFVFFATLIAITTGTVTHKHLFLELPLKLPVLNVELPLMGYFFAVPLFFVVFHFYMLLQLDGLAAKIEDYDGVLREQHPHAADRRLLRQRLDSFIFAQVLVGARDRREGRIGALNRAVAWITMVGLPIGVLLQQQLMFLPYHHQGMTWWHRFGVLADVALVWFFWGRLGGADNPTPAAPAAEPGQPRVAAGTLAALPAIATPIGTVAACLRAGARWAVRRLAIASTAVLVIFTILIAVYPTEWMHEAWLRAPLRPLTRWLLEGELARNPWNQFPERRPWLGYNRLLLTYTDLGVEEKLVVFAKAREALTPGSQKAPRHPVPENVTLSLHDRDFSYAELFRADLREVDLRRADLRGATLVFARLKGAYLTGAQLKGANLSTADLEDTFLFAAQLQGADLSWAHLQGSYLNRAQLQGARLNSAVLRFASLSRAQLQGANLSSAELQGANLRSAQMQGADLSAAQLQGAILFAAQLQGANLSAAQLQGADLSRAQLAGSDLTRTQLRGAKLSYANVYRTACPIPFPIASAHCLHIAGASIADTRPLDLREPDMTLLTVVEGEDDYLIGFRPLSWVDERLSILEPGARTPDQDAQLAARWRGEWMRSVSPSRRAQVITRIACAAEHAPHVARALLQNDRLGDTGVYLHDLAAKMRDGRTNPSTCAGVTGFRDSDWEKLDVLVKAAPPKPNARQ